MHNAVSKFIIFFFSDLAISPIGLYLLLHQYRYMAEGVWNLRLALTQVQFIFSICGSFNDSLIAYVMQLRIMYHSGNGVVRIREVLCSNLGQDIGYSDWGFLDLP
jgi:hypothetical protein